MRSHDFDNKLTAVRYFSRRSDVVGKIDVGDYTLFLDEHLLNQAHDRKVDDFVLKTVLPKIPRAKAKIRNMGAGQHFWLYDNTNQIALGVQVWHAEHKIYMVRTVWNGMPSSDANYPIFNVA